MKKSLFLLMMSAFCTFSFAQEGAELRPERTLEIPYDDMKKVKEALSLSDDQLEKWNQVNDKYYPELKKLEDQDSIDFRTKSSQVRKSLAARDAELKEFIYAAQWDKYQELKSEVRRESMKARREEMMEKRKEMLEKRKENMQKKGDGGNR